MAVGDPVGDAVSVNAAASLTIQPTSGGWTIHNIYHEGSIELHLVKGSIDILFDTVTGSGFYASYAFELSNTVYLQIKNTEASAKKIGYTGKVTS